LRKWPDSGDIIKTPPVRQPLFVLLLSACIVCKAGAQENKPGKLLKVNLNYVQSFDPHHSFDIGDVAPALVLYDTWKNGHELELNEVAIRREDNARYESQLVSVDVGGETRYYNQSAKVGGSLDRSTVVRLRYQYSFCFLKAKKWNPYIGVSNLHTFEKIKKQPYVLEEFTSQFRTGFKRTSVMYDLTLAAVPGIKGTLGKRMVVDLGFPVRFSNAAIIGQRVYNPNLPTRQQRMWLPTSELHYPLWLHLRMGIGISI
jgi:hypothetical protein